MRFVSRYLLSLVVAPFLLTVGVGSFTAHAHAKPSDSTVQKGADVKLAPMVHALSSRAARDTKLEQQGKLANTIPSDEVIIHWKRRLAVTAVGILVLIGTAIFVGWAVIEVRRQGSGLQWTA